ncbi:hypothetical protein HK102_013938 [Quaeritorhiza haematococci]|nr:hypothetical protein HK102_013938 [Quaeritorhiza haematococci]
MVPSPQCKMVHLASSHVVSGASNSGIKGSRTSILKPPTHYTWNDVYTALARNLPGLDTSMKRSTTCAKLYVRGAQGTEYWKKASTYSDKLRLRLGSSFKTSQLAVKVSPIYATNLKSIKRSMTLCINSNDSIPLFDSSLTKAWAMYQEKAYLHWYKKYDTRTRGIEDMLEECFDCLSDARDAYLEIDG